MQQLQQVTANNTQLQAANIALQSEVNGLEGQLRAARNHVSALNVRLQRLLSSSSAINLSVRE